MKQMYGAHQNCSLKCQNGHFKTMLMPKCHASASLTIVGNSDICQSFWQISKLNFSTCFGMRNCNKIPKSMWPGIVALNKWHFQMIWCTFPNFVELKRLKRHFNMNKIFQMSECHIFKMCWCMFPHYSIFQIIPYFFSKDC